MSGAADSLEPWQQRVVQERAELVAKMERLRRFMQSDACQSLPRPDTKLLRQQLGVMDHYEDVLARRIARFTKEAST